jgi:hypothetical protein
MRKTDLIYLIFRRVHTLEISFHEMRVPELSAGGRRMYLSTRRYLAKFPENNMATFESDINYISL